MKKLIGLFLLSVSLSHGQINMGLGAPNGGPYALPTLTAPTDSPGAGTYGSAQTVTLSAAGGTVKCYRLDGTAPTASTAGTCDSPAVTYSGTFSISSGTVVLKAIATEVGFTNSSVLSSTYIISPPSISLLGHGQGHAASNAAGVPATTGAVTGCNGAGFIAINTYVAFNNPSTDITITDSSGNTGYSHLSDATSGFSIFITNTFYKFSPTTSSSMTFTATPVGASLVGITVSCWSGVTTLDTSNTGGLGTGTNCTPPTITPSGSPSLVLLYLESNNAADVISVSSPFTSNIIETLLPVGGASVGGTLAWATSSTAVTPVWAETAGSSNICQDMAVK